MGFWKKISTDTISGLSIRMLAGIMFLVVGVVVVPKFISLPADSVDNVIIKELIYLAGQVVMYVYFIVIFFLPTILEWLTERRQDRNKEWELKNENLKMENEKLKAKVLKLTNIFSSGNLESKYHL